MNGKSRPIAIQGGVASFHDLAAREYFKTATPDLLACKTFKQVCEAVHTGVAAYGVLAIENSLAGSILPNYALLEMYPLHIVGEQYLRISHNLMALPGQCIHDLHMVRSHPMALAQSSEFFEKHPHLVPLESEDTAESAREIAEKNLKGEAAIASRLAAEIFGLKILSAGIENIAQNYTRFFIMSRQAVQNQLNGNKASISFRILHKVGSLAEILNLFKTFHMNLTLIQSVPIPGQRDEYSFNVDLEWDKTGDFEAAMQALQQTSEQYRLLGIYSKGIKPF